MSRVPKNLGSNCIRKDRKGRVHKEGRGADVQGMARTVLQHLPQAVHKDDPFVERDQVREVVLHA